MIKKLAQRPFITSILTVVALLVFPLLGQSNVNAAAAKTATSGYPGGTSAVQIRIAAEATSETVQVAFALDASGSMSSAITSAKSQIKNFAYWVWDNNAQDRTTISVVVFSRQPCGSREDNDYITTPINQIKLTSRAQLDTTLDNISAGCTDQGFTNLTEGIDTASKRLPTSGNNRFLVLLSDGFQNMPRAGSYNVWSGDRSYTGLCPLGRGATSRHLDNISVRWDHFYVIQQPTPQNGWTIPADGASMGMNNYLASCHHYLVNERWNQTGGASSIPEVITSRTFLTRLANAAHGGSEESTTGDISSAITKVKNTILQSIYINDRINTAVFTSNASTISDLKVYSCPSTTGGTEISSSYYDLTVVNHRIYGHINIRPNVTHYCIRFNARVRADVPDTKQDINSNATPSNCMNASSSYNYIRYRNSANTTLSCDTISLGDITVPRGNLDITGFTLRDSGNTSRRVFNTSQDIYVAASFTNNGSATVAGGTTTAFYKNRSSAAAANSPASDIPMYIYNHGSVAVGANRSYNSTQGSGWANNSSSTSPTSQSTARPYRFTQAAGDYTARVFANYRNNVAESSYPTDNQETVSYSVITQPKNLASLTVSCTSVRLSWDAGSSNITGYSLRLTRAGVNSDSNIATTSPITRTVLENSSYTWSLVARTANGNSSQRIDGGSFTTSSCYTPPTGLNHTSLTCNSVTLRWTSGIGSYPYSVQVRQGGSVVATRSIASSSTTSVNITGLNGGTAYTWRIIPSGQSAVNASSGFTTPDCLSYTVSVPGSTTIEPGSGYSVLNFNFNLSPSPSAWSGKTMRFGVVGIRPAGATCSGLSYSSPWVTSGTGAASTIYATYSSTSSGGTAFMPANLQQLPIRVIVGESTPQGDYILCLGSFPTNNANVVGTYNRLFSASFTVQYASWLQVQTNASSISSGEIHSNANIAFRVPFQKHLFQGAPGLITSNSSNTVPTGKLAETIQWSVTSYASLVTSPTYAQLLSTVKNNVGTAGIQTIASNGGSNTPTLQTTCGQSARVVHITGGDAMFNSTNNNINNSNCGNRPLIYFIDGHMRVRSNIVDSSTTSGVVFIVNGNIEVDRSVSRLDGFYIFTRRFTTGPGSSQSTPLTVRGSLVGLAGASPGSLGTFMNGSTSGLLRNLGNGNNNPAETIVYQPKYLELLKNQLGTATISWAE